MRTRATIVGLVVLSATMPLLASFSHDGQAAGPAKAALPAEPPTVGSLAGLMDKELKWGMTHAQVIEAYNKVNGIFDREYAVVLTKMQPGTAMQSVEAERDNRKSQLERSYTLFESSSGYDSLPVHSEFTYRNGEAAMQVRRDNKNRYFFFIKDKLWKIYDEIALSEKGRLGATYDDAISKVEDALGAEGRERAADTSQGVDFPTTDWQDGNNHLRMIDRSDDGIVGVVMEDRNTLRNLSSLRTAKQTDAFALDPSILAVTKHGVSDPNASPPDAVDAGAKGSKKK